MSDIAVSVVVVTYGHERFIAQALDSILMQKVNFNYEIVIGEDKSPDNTREILLKYKKKYPNIIKLVLRDTNIGGTHNAYDIRMNHCQGKYLANLEGDDYWVDSCKLQKQKDFLDNHMGFIAVAHVTEGRDLNENMIDRYPKSVVRGKELTIEKFIQGNYIDPNSLMYRNFFVNSYDQYKKIFLTTDTVGDIIMTLLLLDQGKLFIMDDLMGVGRIRNKKGEHNYNSLFSWDKKYNDAVSIVCAFEEHFNGKYTVMDYFINASAVSFIWAIKNREIKEFYKIYKRSPDKYRKFFWFNLLLKTPDVIIQKIKRILKSL